MAENEGMPSELMVDDSETASESVASLVATEDPVSDRSKRVVLQPSNCVVILNGQKCQLKINPSTGVLIAYPIKGDAANEPAESAAGELSLDNQILGASANMLNEVPETVDDGLATAGNTNELGDDIMERETTSISIFQEDVDHQLQQDAVVDFIVQQEEEDEVEEVRSSTDQTLVVDTSAEGLSSEPLTGNNKTKDTEKKLPELIIPSIGGKVTAMVINREQVMGVTKLGSSLLTAASTSDKGGVIEDVFCPELTITTNVKPLLKQFLITPGGNDGSAIGIKTSGQDLKKLLCKDCNFQAYYPQQYDTHLKEEHASQLHKCRCCAYVTLVEDELTKHYTELHPKNICELCNFVSEHGYVVKRHMYRHSAEGCTCDVCGKTYKDQYILKMHVKMVHNPAEILYQCDFCSKRFTRKAHLKRHARTHSTDKAFGCPHCDYRGCERSDVTKHMLVHEAPKLVCEICCKTFRHQKNKDLHMKRHNGQRDFKCGVCDFFGYTFTDIRKHIERRHTEWKNTICEKCGARFKSHAALQDHVKNWHENPQGSIASSSAGPDAIIFVDRNGSQTSQTDENTLVINADGTLMPSEQVEQVIATGEESVVEYNCMAVTQLEQGQVTITEVDDSMDIPIETSSECVTEIVDLPMNI